MINRVRDSEINNTQTLHTNVTGINFVLECAQIGLTYGTTESISKAIGTDMLKNYRDAIEENNGIIIDLSVSHNAIKISYKLNRIDNILIPGGVDVDPAYYGESEHEKLEFVDKKLDALEARIIAHVRDNLIPILAICRGLQIVNVAFGGSLYQDIPTQFTGLPLIIHRNIPSAFHDINVYEESRLSDILNETKINVNSSHHQGIRDLADGFIVSAKAQDGMIEGIESANTHHYIMGVQFHPETLRKNNTLFNKIFENFISHIE